MSKPGRGERAASDKQILNGCAVISRSWANNEIGEKCNKKDHASVLHGLKEFEALYNQDVFKKHKHLYLECKKQCDIFYFSRENVQKKLFNELTYKVYSLKEKDFDKIYFKLNMYLSLLDENKKSIV